MAPTGSETGLRSGEVFYSLTEWAKRDGSGLSFDSSTGFRLPNGAIRSPDAAWVRRDSWHALSPEQRRGFAPLCPDFVLELRSPSDQLSACRTRCGSISTMARAWLGCSIRHKNGRISTGPGDRSNSATIRARLKATRYCRASCCAWTCWTCPERTQTKPDRAPARQRKLEPRSCLLDIPCPFDFPTQPLSIQVMGGQTSISCPVARNKTPNDFVSFWKDRQRLYAAVKENRPLNAG